MADGKKYYWLRLDRNFFKRHDIRIIENMENGKEYVLFYMKLLLESIDHEGLLRFNELIPYNDSMLGTITNTNIDIVRSAVKLFKQLDMLEILDDQTIFITDTQKMLGEAKSSDRVKRFREKQKQLVIETVGNVTETLHETELELEKEKDIEKDKKKDIKKDIKKRNSRFTPPILYQKKFSDDSFEMKCVRYLITSIQTEMPNAKVPCSDEAIDKWCDSIEKMVRLDKRTHEDIYSTLQYARNDTFWKANIRSTSKFREKYETLYLQMKNKKEPKQQTKSTNKFNQFPQRDYGDMSDLEQKLLNRG